MKYAGGTTRLGEKKKKSDVYAAKTCSTQRRTLDEKRKRQVRGQTKRISGDGMKGGLESKSTHLHKKGGLPAEKWGLV